MKPVAWYGHDCFIGLVGAFCKPRWFILNWVRLKTDAASRHVLHACIVGGFDRGASYGKVCHARSKFGVYTFKGFNIGTRLV